MPSNDNFSRLSDDELVAEAKRLAHGEREATVRLITCLAELDARRLYLGAGFSSLFTYCTEVLRLSEHAAFHRITAARTARRFPVLLRMLAEGSLNLTSVRLLAPHLDEDNQEELRSAATGKSRRELEELLARRFPQPDVASSIRKLPGPRPTLEASALPLEGGATVASPSDPGATPVSQAEEGSGGPPRSPALSAPVPSSAFRPVVTPLAPDRYQITFAAGAETREKLLLAQDLLRHTIPSGDTAAIVDRALTALLRDLAREKFAMVEQPRSRRGPAKPPSGSRHVPAAVKRAVWVRDLGRCAFVSERGRRCNERGFVEFHHVHPYAAGGPATPENIQLRCRAHNGYEADLFFGPASRPPESATRPGPSCVVVTQPRTDDARREPDSVQQCPSLGRSRWTFSRRSAYPGKPA